METLELARKAMELPAHQLDKVLEDFPKEHYDTKLCPEAMSPREMLEHLCECYVNAIPYADGIEPDWGAYKIVDKSWDHLLLLLNEKREAAIHKALTLEGEKLVSIALGFLSVHDAYHVGQLAQLRIHVQPDWNAYSIYE
jgi:hypothetical protein